MDEAAEAPEQAPDEEDEQVPPTYFQNVGKKLAGSRKIVKSFAEERGATLEEHVEDLFQGSGMQDAQARKSMVERALIQQQQFLKEKKAKRTEKLIRAGTKVTAMVAEGEDAGKSMKQTTALSMAALFEVSEMTTQWAQVQAFRSRMEALRFILACQPFDYKPAGQDFDNFPRFQNDRDQLDRKSVV